MRMVTKEDVDKAFAEYKAADAVFLAELEARKPINWAAAIHAYKKYMELREEYLNGN